MRKAAIGVAAALLAIVALVAVAQRPWAKTAGAVVRIAYVGSIGSSPAALSGTAALVDGDGWLRAELAKRGVALQWVPMPNANVGPMTNEAFANHSIDLAGYGDLPSIIANGAGIHTKLIVPGGRGTDAYLVVPADSPAKSILDLKGKRVAVRRGRPWEMPFARLVDSVGLTYADFSIANLDPDAGAAALVAHSVDALFTMATAYTLEDKGVGKIIWSTASSPREWKMLGGLWASADFVERQPELTQLVATAYVRQAAWAGREENRETMIRLATRNGTPESIVRREYQNGSWRDRWSPLFDGPVIDHYEGAIAYAAEKHMIDHTYDFGPCYDERFVLRALDGLDLKDYWTKRSSP